MACQAGSTLLVAAAATHSVLVEDVDDGAELASIRTILDQRYPADLGESIVHHLSLPNENVTAKWRGRKLFAAQASEAPRGRPTRSTSAAA
jgi:hypothetical protein